MSLKKLNRFFYLILGLFILLVFFQNCRMDFVATLSDRSTSSSSILPPNSTGISPVASYSGNGGSYDGKLTFVALEPGFQCENQKSPKAILRFVDDQWYYTLNTEKQCGLIQNQVVQDVNYQLSQNFLTFRGSLFYQEIRSGNGSIALNKSVMEFLVTPLADPNTSDANLGDGICSNSSGLCSLRASIEEANAAHSPEIKFYLIRVARGTYNMNEKMEIQSPVFVGLFGEGPESTIINNTSETGMVRILYEEGMKAYEVSEKRSVVSLQNLSFNQGRSLEGDVAATGVVTYSPLHIKNCVFDDHTGKAPVILGGITSSSLLIEKTKIRGSQNAGIRLLGATNITIDSSEIINNAGIGIALMNFGRNIHITRTTSASNATGVYLRDCYLDCLIENSTISGNTFYGLAVTGGSSKTETTVRNSTITSDATAMESGISIRLARAGGSIVTQHLHRMVLENSLILRGSSVQPNCVFNAEPIQSHQILSVNSIADDASCNGEGNMTVVGNPLLGPLGDHGGFSLTHLLLPGSPAIDAGSDLLCPLSDQRGLMRPVSKTTSAERCDVGAVEVQ